MTTTSGDNAMTIEPKTPEVRMTVDGHICVISLDNS